MRAAALFVALLAVPLALAFIAGEWMAGRRARRLSGPRRCPWCAGRVEELPPGEVGLVGVVRVYCPACDRRALVPEAV